MQEHLPRVCVVVPNKNGIRHLAYSLPSLFASDYSNFQVVLVDDRSSEGPGELVKEKFPAAQVLYNTAKRGFAATVNIGVCYAIQGGAEFVAVSNNDIKIPVWLIRSAVDILSTEKSAGIVGFREVTGDPEAYTTAASPEGKVKWAETKNITGCLFMVRTSVFSKVGLFDEDYFMYGEDNDFFYRARKAGFTTVAADVPVWHYGEGTSGSRPLLSTWLGYRNALRFAIKNFGPLGVLRMLGTLLYHGCFPRADKKSSDLYLKRIRRFNPLFNLILVAASCAWNLFYLPKTLRQRFFPPGGAY